MTDIQHEKYAALISRVETLEDELDALEQAAGDPDQIKALQPTRPIQWFDYPMQHAVCPEELAEIARFLHARLD